MRFIEGFGDLGLPIDAALIIGEARAFHPKPDAEHTDRGPRAAAVAANPKSRRINELLDGLDGLSATLRIDGRRLLADRYDRVLAIADDDPDLSKQIETKLAEAIREADGDAP